MAAISALEALKRPCRVDIHTDSQYLRNGVMSWLANWKRNGWRTADKKPVKNVDLWKRLDAALAPHRGALALGARPLRARLNERADVLAREAIADLRASSGKFPADCRRERRFAAFTVNFGFTSLTKRFLYALVSALCAVRRSLCRWQAFDDRIPMLCGIGLLAGCLLMLLFIPLVHERAVRLTERHLVEATPLRSTRCRPTRIALRAEFADVCATPRSQHGRAAGQVGGPSRRSRQTRAADQPSSMSSSTRRRR